MNKDSKKKTVEKSMAEIGGASNGVTNGVSGSGRVVSPWFPEKSTIVSLRHERRKSKNTLDRTQKG